MRWPFCSLIQLYLQFKDSQGLKKSGVNVTSEASSGALTSILTRCFLPQSVFFVVSEFPNAHLKNNLL